MAAPIIKTSFAAGELAPSLNGRVDLAKYQVGAAVMRNFFVDYRGGASTRPGTQHVGRPRLYVSQAKPRLIPFVFSSDEAYVLELNENTMRVIYQGGYVTENAFAVTAGTRGAQLTLTVPGHNYVPGNFIYVDNINGLLRPNGISGVNGRVLYVEAVAGNVLSLSDISGPVSYSPVVSSGWTAYTSGGYTARIYEIATPWNASALFKLNTVQSADVMTVTSLDFPAYDIRRLGHANWQVVQQTYGTTLSPPSGLTATPQNTGSAATQVFFFAYVVTVVDEDGRESTISSVATCENKALDQTITPVRTNRLTWNPVAGAYKYRVYKAQPIPVGQQGGGPYYYGVVGNVFETSFVDVNFSPDYTFGPPIARNPFLDKGIASANVVSGGTGYLAPYATISDASGSGASIALSSDTSPTALPYGEITVANVVAAGTNYTAPTITVLDAAPAGSGLVLAFNGSWVANPLGTGFVPAPGSITISNPGQNYHFKTANNFIRARAGAPVGSNYLFIDIALVAYGQVQSISWANADISPTASTGLSSTGGSDTLTFEIVGADVVPSGASITVALGGTTNPNCCAYLQQRRVFAGSRSKPATLWLSRPGQFTNFDVSDPIQDDDAITAALNAQEVNIINSMVAATGGLVVLSSGGAYLVSGDGSGITPTTIQANPQAFTGAQDNLQPLRIGNQLLYSQARGSAVAELAYNFYTSQFTSMDISVLSAHLLEGRKIVQWAYATEPFKLVWAVRDDGVLLSLTYLKEQEVYGWARHDTSGPVVSVVSIPEGREDAVYVIVRRYTPTLNYVYAVERIAPRAFDADPATNIPANPEEAWCVDGGARYPLTKPTSAIVSGVPGVLGYIYEVTIDFPGSGYTAPVVEIDDLTGTGGQITLGVTSGQITSTTIVFAGENYTNPQLTIRDNTGSGGEISVRIVRGMTFSIDGAGFTSADIGKVLRVRGGKGVVLSVPSSSAIYCDMQQLPAGMQNYPDYIVPPVAAGEWSLTAPVSVIGGLDHLNGATVQVLVDGSVQSPKVVVDGCITLDAAGTAIIAGQGFTAQLQSMRLEVGDGTLQGRRKTIPTLVMRAKDTRGLTVGARWDDMVEIKQREDENYGAPIVFQDGGERMEPLYEGAPSAYIPLRYPDTLTHLQSDWTEEGVICIQQSWPLPATVLAIIPFMSAGDTVR